MRATSGRWPNVRGFRDLKPHGKVLSVFYQVWIVNKMLEPQNLSTRFGSWNKTDSTQRHAQEARHGVRTVRSGSFPLGTVRRAPRAALLMSLSGWFP